MTKHIAIYICSGLSILLFICFVKQLFNRQKELTEIFRMKLYIKAGYYMIACLISAGLAAAISKQLELLGILTIFSIYVGYIVCENKKELKDLEKIDQ